MTQENYCGGQYDVFDDNLVRECYIPGREHLRTLTNFAHTPVPAADTLCQGMSIEPFQKVELGYAQNYSLKNCQIKENYGKVKLGTHHHIKGSPMGLPIGCNNYREASVCDMNIPNPQEQQPPHYRFTSTSYLKFLDCLPANVRLSVEDPDNPLTFIMGCPYNPNCKCGSGCKNGYNCK